MKVELDKDFVFLNQHVSTFYTGVSSVLTQVKEYILDQFPKEYFKRVMVDTASAASMESKNMENGLYKTSYPYLNIGVVIPSTYDEKTIRPILERSELFIQPNIRQNYPRVLVDPDDNFTLGYTYEWVKLSFEFRVTTNSFMTSIDLMNWIRTKLSLGMTGILGGVPLEFELPQSIVKTIAELQGYDLSTNEGIKDLDRYLMSISRTMSMIKRRVSSTTSQQSYYMSLNSDIQITVDGLEAPTSTIRNNHSEADHTVSFTVDTSAYFPVSFLMKVRKDYLTSRVEKDKFSELYQTENQPLVDGFVSLAVTVPYVNKRDVINYKTSKGKKAIGHLLQEWRFVYGSEQKEPPIVKIFDLIDDAELKRVHAYAVEHSIDLESIFHFEGYKVAYNQDDINFEMNYKDFTINIENFEFSEVLIRFYLNRAMYEAIQKAMNDDVYYFNKNLLCFTDVILWDDKTNSNKTYRVQVNHFKDAKEMYDENPLKALKIKTKYGYGYLNIKPYVEDTTRDEDIGLICLGYNKKLKSGKPDPILYEIVFS